MTNNASIFQQVVVTNLLAGIFTNTATVASTETPTLELNKSNNVATVIADVRGIADVTLAQSGPASVLVTSNITYTIGITNKGGSTATSIVVTDSLPASVSFVSATNTSGTCSNINGIVVCHVNSLINGGGARITIVGTANASGTVTNIPVVTAYETDLLPANNSVALQTVVNPIANLSLGMTGPGLPAYAGNNLVYTMRVTNLGPSSASGVFLTNPLPAGATFISATSSPGTTNLSPGLVIFNIGSLANNATATATLTVRFAIPGEVTNSATVGASSADPSTANNSAAVTTVLSAASDLAVSQIVAPTSAFVSSNITFSVTVTNRGPSLAGNVMITDTLPAGFTLVSAQWNQGSWAQNQDGVLVFTANSLANGASATASIVARPFINGVFTNIASVSGGGDLITSNNTTTATVTINDNPSVPLLRITRTEDFVVLSWSINAQNFFLQAKADLSTNSVWTDVTNTPVQVGNRWHVTNSISGGLKYYRLRGEMTSLSATMETGNRVVVSWPVNAGNATLKSTPDLNNNSVWTVINNPSPVLIGNRYYVTNPATAARRFYRLYN